MPELNKYQFKTWVSNNEFDKMGSGELPFNIDKFKQYLDQDKIQSQISRNAHNWGYSHTEYGAGEIAPHMREKLSDPEALAQREKERADAVASTVKLIAPYGGNESHAIQLHVAANRAASERQREGELASEKAAGVHNTPWSMSMPPGLEDMFHGN